METTYSKPNTKDIDTHIVRAAIHPGIGVARVGNAKDDFFIGPEVSTPASAPQNFYRTPEGELKRQAARFRIFGYNKNGDVVKEITPDDATINWTVEVANAKANWFHFITAMDIPETKDLVVKPRNPTVKGSDREQLVIAPAPVTISGQSTKGNDYQFNGTFNSDVKNATDVNVYLGELQTDEQGRLLFLGGHGLSDSPSGKPPYDPENGDSFNNAADWYDDMSDGPVDASVIIDGKDIPVEGAWVVCTPPNYAPDIVSWRTMYDLMVDVYVDNGWMPVPETTSFTNDVLPQLKRLSNLQWVNKGFAAMFGSGAQMNFDDDTLIAKLSKKPSLINPDIDPFGELRNLLLNSFRPNQVEFNDPRLWPWLYGDDFGGDLFQSSPNTMLALPALQQLHLQRWAKGQFIDDWDPKATQATSIDDLELEQQPHELDKAAMHFCLADAFHPGCEMTWPMRHPGMYSAPFRIRRSHQKEKADKWGDSLNQQQALSLTGPLHAQPPGGLTRWMGLPWQGDTAYCRAGYDIEYDQFQPSFWPARVPNTILSEKDYELVMDKNIDRDARYAVFSRRVSWNRFIDKPLDNGDKPSIAQVMDRMIADFSAQGIIEARPGFKDDPDFPDVIYVENNGYSESDAKTLLQAAATLTKGSRAHKLDEAGWASEEQLQDAVKLRQRKPTKR
ncbi:hypothetical protein GV054_12035 [Marinomonas mediterranea]|uniref:LodA/GoxA family CTQ-dependent oxidase n=1 Tax=Marinomonas mediterranea TaxID=119864 RepID=UPI0023497515|nr:LodA/GoxA family CTQ-dependent oxidase [Marinomonas mediterranea]WCN13679.1 hypothetical protein GV054_12035 [Marinomonas mediterranea]